MEPYKYIPITGEVTYRGAPHKIPDKHYKSAYFTVKCESFRQLPNNTVEKNYDYFTIHTFKENQIEKIKEGFIIECLVRRDGRIWLKDDQIQKKDDYRLFDGKRIYYGSYPIVFESYHLIGDISILNDDVNREEIKKINDDFEDDCPF